MHEEVDEMIREADIDGDGQIDYEGERGRIRLALCMLGPGGESWVRVRLASCMLGLRGGVLVHEEVDEMIREADIDGDGQIDYEGEPGQDKVSTLYAGAGGRVLGQGKVSTLYAGVEGESPGSG